MCGGLQVVLLGKEGCRNRTCQTRREKYPPVMKRSLRWLSHLTHSVWSGPAGAPQMARLSSSFHTSTVLSS